MSRHLTIILSVLLSLCFNTTYGQERTTGQTNLSDTIELYPVTIIALHPKAGEAEALDLDYIDLMAHDGGSILNQIPAFNSIRKGGSYGFDPVFRGFKYDQLNVVLNGAQSATAACPNRMDPPTSQLSPNMIQRIEVLKGPHALRYGSTVGGTINFIPVSPRFTEEKQVYGRLSGGYESNGNQIRSEGMIGLAGKWYDLGVFAAWSQGNDYTTGDDMMVPADFLRSSFGTQLGLKISENQHLKLSATRNVARDVEFASLPMDLRSDDTWMLNANHEVSFQSRNLKSWNTSIYASFVDHLMDNYSKVIDPRMVNARTDATTRNYGGRTEGIWSFNRSRLYTGIDFRIEGARGTREREFLMGPNSGNTVADNVWQDGQITRSGIFAEYHIQQAGIRWVVSGRMEVNASDISDPDPDFLNLYPESGIVQINPGISIGGTKNLTEKLSMGVWLGRAQRSGSLSERFINYFPVGQDPYEMVGNPLIKPEINNQADMNFKWKSTGTSIVIDLFASYMQDLISSSIDTSLTPRLPTSPGVRRFINIEKAFKTGFEFSWGQVLFAGLNHHFSVAYTYGQDLERDEPLPEIAPFDLRYRLSGQYFNQKLRPSVTFRHVVEQSRISGEYGETTTPSFSIIDLGITFQATRLIGITAGVNNVLNVNYYEHLSRSARGATALPIHAPGRSYLVSFSLDIR